MTEELMKYFLIVTDNNGRQYLFEIIDGLLINTDEEYAVTVENPQLEVIRKAIKSNEPFVLGDTLFNPKNVTAIKLQIYPASEI